MLCPACGADRPPEDRFCEECGHRLGDDPATPEDAPCARCGARPGAVDSDGFCRRCGFQRVGSPRDHVEVVVGPHLAGVSDRGRKHHRNEDALALVEGPGGSALVVCDGVSSSQDPDAASTAAAEAAASALAEGLADPDPAPGLDALARAAIEAASRAVRGVPIAPGSGLEPPETTIVLAVRCGRRLVVGWVGDSRAYLLAGGEIRPLTRDHSWAVEVVAAGHCSMAEALESPLAHAVTRVLGGPEGDFEAEEPEFAAFDLPDGPGVVLLCSDGLWNYAPDVASLTEALRNQPPGPDASTTARGLVDFANSRGGSDNVTVAVLLL